MKKEVLEQLVNRRIGLVEAAVRIYRVSDPEKIHSFLEDLDPPGQSQGERVCRLVIYWARQFVGPKTPAAEDLGQRLEAELRQELQRQGFIDLMR